MRCSCPARFRLTTRKPPDRRRAHPGPVSTVRADLASHRREAELAPGEAARLASDELGDAGQLARGGRLWVGEYDRQPPVACLSEPYVDRHLTEQRHAH